MLLNLGASLAGAAPRTICHIHPPGSDAQWESGPRLIGPYSSADDCEAERRARFGDLGRCHCVRGFGPLFVPGRDRPASGGAPAAGGGNLPLP